MWDILIPILTFLVGALVGCFVAYKLILKKVNNMQASADPKQIQALAEAMGMKLNQKQLNMATKQMQKHQQKPTPKPNKTKKKK